jgi:uncharacterized linocin/CFP29 family protein
LLGQINADVHQQINQSAICRKVLPVAGPSSDALVASNENVAGVPLQIDSRTVVPVVELYVELLLGQEQPEQLHPLAMKATRLLAQGEDAFVLAGSDAGARPPFSTGAVKTRPDLATANVIGVRNAKTLFAGAPGPPPVPAAYTVTPGPKPWIESVAGVAEAIAALQGDGHYGSYALIMDPTACASLEAGPGSRRAQIELLVEEGIGVSGQLQKVGAAANEHVAVLIAVEDFSIDVFWGVDATLEYSHPVGGGMHCYRVYERLVPRIKDHTAIRFIKFA